MIEKSFIDSETTTFCRDCSHTAENCSQQWLTDFRNDPFFKLIVGMMNLRVTPREAKDCWDQISGQVQIITKDYLWRTFGVDDWHIRVQDRMDFYQLNFASLSLLDRWFLNFHPLLVIIFDVTNFRVQGKATLSKTETKTIENQGETEFCWLYSVANAIVSSLWARVGE